MFHVPAASAQSTIPSPPGFPSSISLYQQAYLNWSGEIIIQGVDSSAVVRSDPGIKPLLVPLGRAFITDVTRQAGADVNLQCVSWDHPQSTLFAHLGPPARSRSAPSRRPMSACRSRSARRWPGARCSRLRRSRRHRVRPGFKLLNQSRIDIGLVDELLRRPTSAIGAEHTVDMTN